MQESLYNTVQRLQTEQKVNVEDLEVILGSDIEEVVSLCKKACLKPKTDSLGNTYFNREDVDILKKMKALYNQSRMLQQNQKNISAPLPTAKPLENDFELDNPENKISILKKAKNRLKGTEMMSLASSSNMLSLNLEKLENNLVTKIGDMLSEKMDGFDEIIVELIRAKTENENLRQQVNTLNKQVFSLKNELGSYIKLPAGLYIKKNNKEL